MHGCELGATPRCKPPSEDGSRDILSRLIGKRCEATVEVEGIRVRCLLDSGSQISTISVSHFNQHLAGSHTLHPIAALVTIEAANGLPISYEGFVQVGISVTSDHAARQDHMNVLMFVCPDTSYSCGVPVVLGTNVLSALCEDQVESTLRGNAELAEVLSSFQAIESFRKDHAGHVGEVRVCSRRAIVVPPGETVYVRGRCHARRLGQSYPAIAEGILTEHTDRDGLSVVSTLITVPRFSRSTVRIPVQNLTGHSISLTARSVLADLFLPAWIRPVGIGDAQSSVKVTCMKTNVIRVGTEDISHLDGCHVGPDLPTGWASRARSLLARNADVFSRNELDVGRTSKVKHRIILDDVTPFKERSRPIASRDLDDARDHIRGLLDAGIIRESNSQYASPIVLVRKKDGSLRLTVDYRKLNKRAIKDAYALPRIDDAFSRLSGAKWFSVMDLKSGYYQVEMEPCDQDKTAFVCPLGFYEYTRMPQGITNAPATFQRLMERCMGSMNLQEVLAFLDDMIVFSSTLDEHEERLSQVLDRLRTFGLKLNPRKCSFFCRSVSYLGHTVSETGISCDPSKVDAVREWPRPGNMKELRSFLGFAGYYRKFVCGFSTIALPLTTLLKGYTRAGQDSRLRTNASVVRKPFGTTWTPECEDAFNALKRSLIQAPVLAIADPTLPYELHTDASGSGLGAALYQKQGGVLRPVAFASRGLSASELNYPAHKMEFLALRWAVCHKFHDFLYGTTFRVVTDNNPLTYVLTTARLDATGHRWLAALSTYDFDIVYRAGQQNADADGLSRRPHEDDHVEDPVWERQERRIASLLQNTRQIEQSSIIDAGAVVNAVLEARTIPAVCSLPIADSAVLDEQPELSALCMPSLSAKEQREAQLADPIIARVRSLLETRPLNQEALKTERQEVATMMRRASTFHFSHGVLYKDSTLSGSRVRRLVVPSSLRPIVYQGIHDDVGHLSADRGVTLARTRFYWYRMESDIQAYCKGCVPCTLRKAPPERAAMHSLQSSGPMDLVCIDFLKVDTDRYNKSYVLVITDHFTRFARAIPMRNQTARAVADVLWKEFFLDFGFPGRLHSDRGASFTGKLLRELAKVTGVKSSFTTPYHPQGNAQVERFNRTLLFMLGTLSDTQKQEWSKHVRYLAHAYNCTQHDATQFSPFYLMFGRNPRLKVDWLFARQSDHEDPGPSSIQYVRELQERLVQAHALADEHAKKQGKSNKVRYDRKVRPSGLRVGGKVLLRNVAIHERRKLANNWLPDVYLVLRQQGGDSSPVFVVRREDGKGGERTLHRNMMLPCDRLALPVEPVKLSSPTQKRPRRTQQRHVSEASSPHLVWVGKSSSSSDEYEEYCKAHARRPRIVVPSSVEPQSDGSPSDDEPLARLVHPGIQPQSPLSTEHSEEDASRVEREP